jgi:hypothetical protein
MATKLAMTVSVKAMDSQRWICRIHVFQFNETSSEDEPKLIRRLGCTITNWRRCARLALHSVILDRAMKLQQLRYVLEITRHGNHLSAAAEALNTSQPGVSRQIQLLEAELGFEIFLRTRNRIIGLTPPSQRVVDIA